MFQIQRKQNKLHKLFLVISIVGCAYSSQPTQPSDDEQNPPTRPITPVVNTMNVVAHRPLFPGRPQNIFHPRLIQRYAQAVPTNDVQNAEVQPRNYAKYQYEHHDIQRNDLMQVESINTPYDIEQIIIFMDNSGSTEGIVSLLEHRVLERGMHQLKTFCQKDMPLMVIPFSNRISLDPKISKTLMSSDDFATWMPYPNFASTHLSSYISRALTDIKTLSSLPNTLCMIIIDGEIDADDREAVTNALSEMSQYYGLNNKRFDLFVIAAGELAERTQTQQRWMQQPTTSSDPYQTRSDTLIMSTPGIMETQATVIDDDFQLLSQNNRLTVQSSPSTIIHILAQASAAQPGADIIPLHQYPLPTMQHFYQQSTQSAMPQEDLSQSYARIMSEFSSITGSSRCCKVYNMEDFDMFDQMLREIASKKGRKTLYVRENNFLRFATDDEKIIMTKMMSGLEGELSANGITYVRNNNGLLTVNGTQNWFLAPNDVVESVAHEETSLLSVRLANGIAEDSPYLAVINILNGV